MLACVRSSSIAKKSFSKNNMNWFMSISTIHGWEEGVGGKAVKVPDKRLRFFIRFIRSSDVGAFSKSRFCGMC